MSHDRSWLYFLSFLVLPVLFFLLRAGRWKTVGVLALLAFVAVSQWPRLQKLRHPPPPILRSIACEQGRPDYSEVQLDPATLLLPCLSKDTREALQQGWRNLSSGSSLNRTSPEELAGSLTYYKTMVGTIVGTATPQPEDKPPPADTRYRFEAAFFKLSAAARPAEFHTDGEQFNITLPAPAPLAGPDVNFNCQGPGVRYVMVGIRRYPFDDFKHTARCLGALSSIGLEWRVYVDLDAPAPEGEKWKATDERVAGYTQDLTEAVGLIAAHIR